jgi:Concanavalin A-like lectin/glucanases superfamily
VVSAVSAVPLPDEGVAAADTGDAGPATVASESEALAVARQTNRRVEVGSLRGETREVYVEADGSFTATQHVRPVRARKNGRWVDIDTTLRRAAAGSVAPVASSVDLTFSGGGDGPMVRMSRAGRELALTWPGTLPRPVIDGAVATYPDVLPGVDLQLKAEVDGVSQVLVVHTAEAAANPRLGRLVLMTGGSGLRVERDADGGLRAVDSVGGGSVFAAPAPVMWDSSQPGSASSPQAPSDGGVGGSRDPFAGPADGVKVASIQTEVAAGKLTLVPDQGLLTAADTRWPVFIDPAWRMETESAWLMVSSGGWQRYNFSGTEGMGRCIYASYSAGGDPACGSTHTKRLFYRIPTSFFAGKTILSAQFTAWETHAYNCNNPTVVQLWRTKGFTTASTWSSTSDNWVKHIDDRDVAYCSSTPVEFNAKAAVVEAAAGKWSTTTFGLKAYSESSMAWWKRFDGDAALRVNYNRAPYQVKMSQLTMSPGGACVDLNSPPSVNKKPVLYAKGLTDPDGDKVSAQFGVAWDGGSWTSPTIGPKASGSTNVFSFDLGASGAPVLPQNVILHWHVRVSDGTVWSPWSWSGNATSCYFKYDATVPSGPTITSADGRYPKSDPANENDPWLDGVGKYGKFTLDSAATDVTRYWFGFNTSPTQANERTTTGGAPVTINVMPTTPGLNFITAKALDAAGNVSQTETYYFRVRSGSPPRAQWSLNETSGMAQVTAAVPDSPASVHGGVTLGTSGTDGTAARFDGTTGYLQTQGPVLDTDQSFSVAAWAKLDAKGLNLTILSQDGSSEAGFYLGYETNIDRWAFRMRSADVSGASWINSLSTSPPDLNVWTHLVGVYDATAGRMQLYVNGVLQQSTAHTSAWAATGPFNIGRGKWQGGPSAYWRGSIDDVRVFDYPLLGNDAAMLFAHQSIPTKPERARWNLDESAGSTQVAGNGQPFVAAVNGGATLGSSGMDGSAMHLDGSNDYAATTGPVINTAESFSVAAWAKLEAKGLNRAVLSQDGSSEAGFYLSYETNSDRWAFRMRSADAPGSGWIYSRSTSPPDLNVWTHLVGVYDATAGQMRLYVNGVLQQTTAHTSAWAATGPFTIGRGKWLGGPADYWSGSVDEVQVFSRVVTGPEAQDLFQQHPVLVGRWKLNTDGGDEASSPHPLSLAGSAMIDGGAGLLGDPPGGLVLDGVGGYAATNIPVVRTDQSFTVAGWVTTAGRPTANAAVFSQAGSVNSGFTLRYSPTAVGGTGGYEIEMPVADTAGAAAQKADHVSFQSAFEWDHVAIVYDAFQDEMRLYVNGQLDQVEDGSRESYRSNTVSFNATDPAGLQLGRSRTNSVWGEYWPGVLDDMWAFSGALSEDQIQRLAFPAEEPTSNTP